MNLNEQPEVDSGFPEHHAELDASGLLCPEPVMLLHNRVRDLAPGEILKAIATDPSTRRDIPRFCHFLGHDLIRQAEQGEYYLYWIRKKSE